MAAGVDDILNDLIARVGRVRRWLLALSTLRIAALGLACVSAYVGSYAWLDHRVHFGTGGRVSALALFVVLTGVGLYFIIRTLRRDMTYANAANYIEGRRSFDQQLVAAVEYYEGRADYPYSKALAGELVRQVDRAAEGYRFDSTIDKWQGYLLAAFVLLCMGVAGLFIRQNVLYICSYLGRMLRPFAAIEPIPATSLESTSGDLVAGVDEPVTFRVAAEGRTPESVTLVLTRHEPNDANQPSPEDVRRIEMTPTVDADGRTAFAATESFDAAGQFEYRFEAADARSDSHAIRVCELPSIKSVKAKVFPPPMPEGTGAEDAARSPATQASAEAGASPRQDASSTPAMGELTPDASETPGDHGAGETPPIWGQPYEVDLTDKPLAVLPHSRVELEAQATMGLREAVVVGPDGQAITQSLDGADRFGFEFTADASSSLRLSGISTDGLAGREAKELRVVLKSDEPPQFKLVSPEGDYLATDVASVPIAFEVTDDFGLVRARLVCELPGREPVVLESASPQGAKQALLSYMLELERYDLHVGDGILFYATARDVRTGHRRAGEEACSDLYFIEIRPYRQYWHTQPGGDGPSSAPGGVAEDLITILEYTRAIVKKTWALVHSPQTPAEDHPKLEALAEDVAYCASRLAKLRDDPEAGFSDGDKAVMNRVLGSYGQARGPLEAHDANTALPPIQDAYRILRMFIDELHMKWSPPESSPSPPAETPERIKLQEQPQESRMEAERVESRLQEMKLKIDSLSRQQESLKADLAKTLKQEKGTQAKAQSGQGSAEGSQEQSQQGEQAGTSQQSQSGTDGGGAQGQQGTQDSQGQSDSSGSSGSGGQGEQSGGAQASGGQGGQAGDGQQGRSSEDGQSGQGGQASGGRGKTADSRQDGSGPAGAEATRPNGSQGGAGPGSASAEVDARMRMLQAKQKALREQASELSGEMAGLPVPEYSSHGRAKQQAKGHLDQAVEAMEQFEEHLADARYEPADASRADDMANLADSAARRLADAGQAIGRGLAGQAKTTADAAQEMAEQLARDAEAYDESLSEAEKQKMLERLAAAERLLENMAGVRWTTISAGGGPAAGHVYTNDPHASPAENARLLAQQFWSMAIEAGKRRGRPVEEESSDVEFFEAESEFFEDAARFGSGGVEK